jgi:hypothetical protein
MGRSRHDPTVGDESPGIAAEFDRAVPCRPAGGGHDVEPDALDIGTDAGRFEDDQIGIEDLVALEECPLPRFDRDRLGGAPLVWRSRW